MEKTNNPVLRIIRTINEVAVVTLFAAMTVTVIVQVFFRFVLHSPLRWTEEMARYLMIWLVLLASGIAVRNQAHLQVDVLTASLPKGARRTLTFVVDVLTIAFLCIMTFYGFQVVQATMAQTSPAMQVPMALIYAAFPTGGVLMIIEQIIVLLERLRAKDAPEAPREFLD